MRSSGSAGGAHSVVKFHQGILHNVHSGMLCLIVKGIPGIVIVRREHVPGLEAADEVVVTVDVPVVAVLHEPRATTRAAGHVTGDGDHRASSVLPAGAGPFAGLSRLPIKGGRSRIAIGRE